MIPVICQTKDDCVRACVASILELEPATIPHWFENPEIGQFEMQKWLAGRDKIAAAIALPGDWGLPGVLLYMADTYPKTYYMLFCNSGGDHAVVGRGAEIVHNPAWYRCGIDGPHSLGAWIVWIIADL